MFFVSDMPGGYGGTDIYRTDLINGEWSEPVNLGSNINSSGMDLFPFYHPSGRLYFSSSRAGGVGGFDIYYSGKTNEGWHPAVVAAEPLNSMYNDFSFCCDETQESGFFASNREGSDDIFSFRLNWPIFDQCDSLKKNNYCFTFFETGNYNLDTMPLRYEWDIAGLEKISGLEADYCFEGQGNYLIKLNIIDTLTGDIFYNQATYDFKIRDIEQVYIDAPDSCIPGTPVHMDGSKTSLPGFLPGNYYWDFGDGNKAMGASVGHVYDEEGSYTITLGVRSLPDEDHISRTACVIKTIYVRPNLQYADNHDHTEIKTPADSVNPTTHEKPDLKQYGEEDIIEDKVYKVEVAKSADPIPIEDQYFDALRDLYTIMESYLSGDSVYSYTVGNETNIMNTYMIYQKVKKLGYDDALVKSFDIVPESLTVSDTLAKVLLNNLLGQWQIILFDYNEYSISPESYDMLDKVYNVLNKYQSLIIEIAAHTDDIGTDEYNRELSEKRAISVTEYLVSKGISHERLIPKGYGKSKPLTKGTSEANRAKNRRVEFIVVKTGFE
ncbi:MAG: OmpA family protein [Bacteroidota bacterium]